MPDSFVGMLSAALMGGDVASVIVALDTENEDVWRQAASILAEPAIRAGAAFLLKDRLDLVTQLNADGLHVESGMENLPQLVETLAPGKIVGAGGVTNRHDAMIAGETGVDYVLFGSCNCAAENSFNFDDVKKLTEWWAEIIELPCVAPARSLQEVRELAECGADFVVCCDLVWTHSDGPAAAVAEINTVFDEIAAL
ncbi:MAG: thiamine phosphate synthase [Fimbriimonadaceae bacterium]|nr:thiamine phosphate synthase [Alphaproteobacteria bacterium]